MYAVIIARYHLAARLRVRGAATGSKFLAGVAQALI